MLELYQALDIHHNISTNLKQSHGDDEDFGVELDLDDKDSKLNFHLSAPAR